MTESTGRIEAIWRKRSHGGQMDAVTEAMLVEGKGIAENVDRGGSSHGRVVAFFTSARHGSSSAASSRRAAR